jgi:hypothetical protein
MKRLAFITALALAGCANQDPGPPVIKTVEVKVPAPVSCVPDDLPGPKVYPDEPQALLDALSPVARARLIEEGWAPRDSRLKILESVIDTCRKAPGDPGASH